MSLSEITKEADKKRRFHYSLKSFDQIFEELERLEAREAVMIKYMARLLQIVKSPTLGDEDTKAAIHEVLMVLFDEMKQLPNKSPGFHMIETMGIEFYEALRKDILEDGDMKDD